jgi:hypothetical protein
MEFFLQRLERSKGRIIEKFWYHEKPTGWNSCRPDQNPKSPAGLIRKYEKTFPLTGYRHTIDYTYDDRQNLVRKREVKITPIPGSTAPNVSIGGNTVPSDAGYWEEDITWQETFPGSQQWERITKVKAPGGNLGNSFNTTNGVPSLAIIDAPPKVSTDSPPESPPTAPRGFDVVETPLEVIIRAPGRGGGLAVRQRPLSVESALSEAQLRSYGELLVALSWGRAYGRKIEIPLYDALLAVAYRPIQRWDYDDGTRKIALRAAEPALVLDPTRCMVGVEASKIGDVNPDGTVTTPFALIYDAGDVFEIVAGCEISFPPQPPIAAGEVFEILGGEPPLRWSVLTQQQWYTMTQSQYARMLQ